MREAPSLREAMVAFIRARLVKAAQWSSGEAFRALSETPVRFNDSTWFDRSGNHHSDPLHVIERYTPSGPNTLRYEATLTDPEVFTRPWKISMTLYRRIGEDARLQQFKCVEFVEELLYGHLRKEPLK